MAKLKAPLLSFGASGKLADTLVYFPWKGLAVVRSYVIPANPNSAGQQTQRGILTESVASWHALGLDDDDVTAWNRYAASRPTPQSGFNAFVKDFVDLRVSGVILADTDMCYNGGLVDDGDGTFSAAVSTPAGPDHVDMIWGYSPTSLINTVPDAAGPPRGWTGTYRPVMAYPPPPGAARAYPPPALPLSPPWRSSPPCPTRPPSAAFAASLTSTPGRAYPAPAAGPTSSRPTASSPPNSPPPKTSARSPAKCPAPPPTSSSPPPGSPATSPGLGATSPPPPPLTTSSDGQHRRLYHGLDAHRLLGQPHPRFLQLPSGLSLHPLLPQTALRTPHLQQPFRRHPRVRCRTPL